MVRRDRAQKNTCSMDLYDIVFIGVKIDYINGVSPVLFSPSHLKAFYWILLQVEFLHHRR